METKIIFDLSYAIFFTIYSMISHPNDLLDFEIEELLEKFTLRFFIYLSTFLDYKPKIYFAKDCPRKKIWRKKIVPSYKKRKNKSYSQRMSPIFNHVYSTLLPQLVKNGIIKLIEIEGAEADDIIGLFVERYRRNKIIIVTNDKDLYQLKKYGNNVSFFTMENRCKDNQANFWFRKFSAYYDKNKLFQKFGHKKVINLSIVPRKIRLVFNEIVGKE